MLSISLHHLTVPFAVLSLVACGDGLAVAPPADPDATRTEVGADGGAVDVAPIDAGSAVDFGVSDALGDDGPPCAPASCAALGFNCGLVSDRCGGYLRCGTCLPNQSCGGGGMPNVCGAPPAIDAGCGGSACCTHSCADVGATCGIIDDGCGNIIECGTCPAPLTCGGAGVANVCGVNIATVDAGPPVDAMSGCGGPFPGCCPITCAELGIQCGVAGDGCGGELDCGGCPSGESCGHTAAGQCG